MGIGAAPMAAAHVWPSRSSRYYRASLSRMVGCVSVMVLTGVCDDKRAGVGLWNGSRHPTHRRERDEWSPDDPGQCVWPRCYANWRSGPTPTSTPSLTCPSPRP